MWLGQILQTAVVYDRIDILGKCYEIQDLYDLLLVLTIVNATYCNLPQYLNILGNYVKL